MSLLAKEQLERIEQMPSAKRDAMLNAAMQELQKGYREAGTDRITAAAGISKGLLFHYFGPKEHLLPYPAEAPMDLVQRDVLDKVDFGETDLFRRLWRLTSRRFDLIA